MVKPGNARSRSHARSPTPARFAFNCSTGGINSSSYSSLIPISFCATRKTLKSAIPVIDDLDK
jgi:hypothetical protein